MHQARVCTPRICQSAAECSSLEVQVHSKLMIVDDEYILLGSANINQRSQDGTRDTEIAVGASQHKYHNQDSVMPRGQVIHCPGSVMPILHTFCALYSDQPATASQVKQMEDNMSHCR